MAQTLHPNKHEMYGINDTVSFSDTGCALINMYVRISLHKQGVHTIQQNKSLGHRHDTGALRENKTYTAMEDT